MTEQTEAEQLAYWLDMLATNTRLFSERASQMVEAAKRAEYFARKLEAALDKRVPSHVGEAIGCAALIGLTLMAMAYGQVLA